MNTDSGNKTSSGSSAFQVPPEKTAYVIITVKITNRDKFLEYVKGHIPSVIQYGGIFRFEGIGIEDVENSTIAGENPNMLIIQEWPDKARFYEWWNSEEYRPWKEMRPQGADVTVTLSGQRGEKI